MIALLILPILALIITAGYLELRDMPRSKGRPTSVMQRDWTGEPYTRPNTRWSI